MTAPRISAFPKCYLDQIAGARTMSVFEWIEMARSLDADGLEMYDGFFTSLDADYLDRVGAAIHEAGFVMPMLCCSPDFTNPEADGRKRAIERHRAMCRGLVPRRGADRASVPHVAIGPEKRAKIF
jgi:sugar phosphate isomerase/epimerase